MDLKLSTLLVVCAYISTTQAHPPCVCDRNIEPVCGSDGVSYNNECLLDCAASRTNTVITVAMSGPCETPKNDSDAEQCFCILSYAPVCGTDGKTYSNECKLNCEKRNRSELQVKHKGDCVEEEEDCVCNFINLPVCGTDNKTYANECILDCEKRKRSELQVKHKGACVEEEEDCVCNFINLPVCGTDGKTYANECVLDCTKRKQKNLEIKHKGNCTS